MVVALLAIWKTGAANCLPRNYYSSVYLPTNCSCRRARFEEVPFGAKFIGRCQCHSWREWNWFIGGAVICMIGNIQVINKHCAKIRQIGTNEMRRMKMFATKDVIAERHRITIILDTNPARGER